MKFIVVSGSMRFYPKFFDDEAVKITIDGNIPYCPFVSSEKEATYDKIKPILENLYFEVIRLYADELRVINVGGYVGESTRAEIACAEKKGIPITYLEGL